MTANSFTAVEVLQSHFRSSRPLVRRWGFIARLALFFVSGRAPQASPGARLSNLRYSTVLGSHALRTAESLSRFLGLLSDSELQKNRMI